MPRPRKRDPFGGVATVTQAILQHQRATNAVTLDSRAEQGRLLLEARAGIPEGSWRIYIATKLPFSRGTADRAVELYFFRERHPELFDQLRAVGLTMAYFLVRRPVAELGPFLSRAHHVPSVGASKTPSAMSVEQAMEVLLGTPEEPDPARDALSRSRRAGRQAIAQIRALIDHRDAVDPEEVADLYEDLVEALTELGAAFGLED